VLHSGDRCGLVAFDNRVRGYLAPMAGPSAVSRLVETAADLACDFHETDFLCLFTEMQRRLTKRCLLVVLTDIGDRYVIEVGTEKGGELLSKYASTDDASDEDLKSRDKVRNELPDLCKTDRKITCDTKHMTETVSKNYSHPLWEKQAEKCYSCGACNLVCPTCYCFDVKDNIELDLAHGERSRAWDGCLLNAFAKVGTGENFREHRTDRFRHRIFRKMVYVAEQKLDGELACVGCGRCSSACLPDITDPVKIVNELCG